jgi:hypothetical protein
MEWTGKRAQKLFRNRPCSVARRVVMVWKSARRERSLTGDGTHGLASPGCDGGVERGGCGGRGLDLEELMVMV